MAKKLRVFELAREFEVHSYSLIRACQYLELGNEAIKNRLSPLSHGLVATIRELKSKGELEDLFRIFKPQPTRQQIRKGLRTPGGLAATLLEQRRDEFDLPGNVESMSGILLDYGIGPWTTGGKRLLYEAIKLICTWGDYEHWYTCNDCPKQMKVVVDLDFIKRCEPLFNKKMSRYRRQHAPPLFLCNDCPLRRSVSKVRQPAQKRVAP